MPMLATIRVTIPVAISYEDCATVGCEKVGCVKTTCTNMWRKKMDCVKMTCANMGRKEVEGARRGAHWRSGWSTCGGVRPLPMRWMGIGCPAAYKACATLNITWEPIECPKKMVGLSSRGRMACT
jgi:hypothetical protein